MDIKNFSLRYASASLLFFFFMGFLSLVILIGLLVSMDFSNPNNVSALWIAIPLSLVFPAVAFFMFRWKITIKDDQITVRPILGSAETFNFEYISRVKHTVKSTQFATRIEHFTAYCGGRELFTVTSFCQNFMVFIALMKAKGVNIEWVTKEMGEYIDKRTEEYLNEMRSEVSDTSKRENNEE